MSVAGKVVIVTGATSGVGRAIASVWAARGAKVLACGRRADLGEQLEAEAVGDLAFVRTDVSVAADARALVAETVRRHGRVDVLVNNAGVEGDIVDFHMLADEQWDYVLDINLRGAFLVARAVVAQLLEQDDGGTLLHIASTNATQALAHMAPYNAAKAGLIQLSNTIAVEYLLTGIRSNVVVLGGAEGESAVRTTDGLARTLRGADYVRPTESGPLEQLVQKADEVAAFLALLAHDDARLLTGATVELDRAVTAGFATSILSHMTAAGLWGAP